MKTRWMIPGAVALSLHALILLGFRSAPRPAVPHSCPLLPPTPATQRLTLAELPEVLDSASSAPAGSPAVPRSEEPVVAPRLDHPVFTMVPAAVTPGPIEANHIIPSGMPGLGDGTAPGPGVISAVKLDHAPQLRAQIAPVSPYEAKALGKDGEVLVEFTVDEEGRVLHAHVLRSTDAVFEAATLRAVSQWRFEPGRHLGRVVRFRMAQPVQFSLAR